MNEDQSNSHLLQKQTDFKLSHFLIILISNQINADFLLIVGDTVSYLAQTGLEDMLNF